MQYKGALFGKVSKRRFFLITTTEEMETNMREMLEKAFIAGGSFVMCCNSKSKKEIINKLMEEF